MPYTVTRQSQWPSGDKVVEVSLGNGYYTNPDALVGKYPDEGRTFDSPVEAVEAAIRICQAWRQDGAPDAQVGYGATYGMTMPLMPPPSMRPGRGPGSAWRIFPGATGAASCCPRVSGPAMP